jgi:hypothetical protein
VKVTDYRRDPEAAIVRYGPSYAVPAHFTATVEPDESDKPGLPICHLTVVVDHGRATCEELRVERGPEGKPITGTVLRELALGEYVKVATAKVAYIAVQHPRGAGPLKWRTEDGEETTVLNYRIDDEWVAIPAGGLERSERFERETRKSDRRHRGTRVTDDELRRVADIYRAAHVAREAPTAAVAAQLHVSRSTAGRYVQQGRARGFLGPTRPRVAGEDS